MQYDIARRSNERDGHGLLPCPGDRQSAPTIASSCTAKPFLFEAITKPVWTTRCRRWASSTCSKTRSFKLMAYGFGWSAIHTNEICPRTAYLGTLIYMSSVHPFKLREAITPELLSSTCRIKTRIWNRIERYYCVTHQARAAAPAGRCRTTKLWDASHP